MKANTKKYYIYHIPGIKWGCTDNLERRLKRQNYKIEDLGNLIIVGNLDKAADLEAELNKEYGYKYQSTNYRNILSGGTSKGGKIGGKTQGNKNKESGFIYTIFNRQRQSENGIKQSQTIHICPHCNKKGKSNAMFRHHFNNCKLLTIMR